ncbi:hypothetical protein T4A_7477 [Trichinella pseudospiralis]|uniref:Uncharacterized protein n=1 Tax=Trichinella pseudospiralis TaxID=6337 RepID=A0A0V1EQS4_TRIPS|nr:hypothetical protein T4A_7477 [Trichinella pseudospiralis]
MVTTPNNKDSEKCLKTAIAIPFSLYEYTRMQFSLRNEEVSQALRFLDIYIDDVLVAYPIDEFPSDEHSFSQIETSTIQEVQHEVIGPFHPVNCYVTGIAGEIEI